MGNLSTTEKMMGTRPTAGMIRKALIYDPKSGIFTWANPINRPDIVGEIAGNIRVSQGRSYWAIKFRYVTYVRSQLAVLWMTGEWPKNVVDHIDGNSMNDSWANLRLATTAENGWNRRPTRNRDLPLGVYADKDRYRVRVKKLGVTHNFGTYSSEEEARLICNQARKKLFGDFASESRKP